MSRAADKEKNGFNIFDMVRSNENDEDADEHGGLEIDSEDIRSRLAGLVDSDESDADVTIEPIESKKRVRIQLADSESSDADGETIMRGIDAEDIRERLAELNESDDSKKENATTSTTKFNRIIDSEDSDTENNQSSVNAKQQPNGNAKKRERSRSSSDDEMSAKSSDTSVAKKRKSRQIVDSDDDDNTE